MSGPSLAQRPPKVLVATVGLDALALARACLRRELGFGQPLGVA